MSQATTQSKLAAFRKRKEDSGSNSLEWPTAPIPATIALIEQGDSMVAGTVRPDDYTSTKTLEILKTSTSDTVDVSHSVSDDEGRGEVEATANTGVHRVATVENNNGPDGGAGRGSLGWDVFQRPRSHWDATHDGFWANMPRAMALSSMYLDSSETKARGALLAEESSQFMGTVVGPFVRGCVRLARDYYNQTSQLTDALKKRRDDSRFSGVDNCQGSPPATVAVLDQQLKDQRARHADELERLRIRREREVHILHEGYRRQLQCMDEQIQMLKSGHASSLRSASRIRLEADEISMPFARPLHHSSEVARDSLRRGQASTNVVRGTTRSVSPSSLPLGSIHSANPRHDTVICSIDGSAWRSLYLVVSVQGCCSFGESMSGPTQHLFSIAEVRGVRQGNSRHPQRPLLLSIEFGTDRQLDLALNDKGEREFWRQSFRAKHPGGERERTQKPGTPTHALDAQLCRPQSTIGVVESVPSTPSLSSAIPVPDSDNPTLKNWLEVQADNVRRGDLDPDNGSLTNTTEVATPDDDSREQLDSAKRRHAALHLSPAPCRPPLGSNREVGVTTMSTSSRDRLPPLAPQQKRRSTISGSASTADSWTEEEVLETAPTVPVEEPIAPVSPSHSSDSCDSPATIGGESIKLSPELSPMMAVGPGGDDVPGGVGHV